MQEQKAVAAHLFEVEHLRDGVGDSVEGTLANTLSSEPVVFDEADNRTLVRDRTVDKVLPSPRRNDQQRQSRTVAAAAKGVSVG